MRIRIGIEIVDGVEERAFKQLEALLEEIDEALKDLRLLDAESSLRVGDLIWTPPDDSHTGWATDDMPVEGLDAVDGPHKL